MKPSKILDVVNTLTKLGLTNNQAKTYFALVTLEKAPAKEIAEMSNITRQDVYRILPHLEEMGFVEKEISKPTIFRAIPLQETLQALLKKRGKETLDLKKQIGSIIENVYTQHSNKIPKQKESEIIFVPGKRSLLNRVQKSIQNMQKNLLCITSYDQLRKHMSDIMDSDLFTEKKRKNSKILIITEIPKRAPTQKIVNNKNFEHRFVCDPPQAHLLIVDEKEVFIKTSVSGIFGERPSIWSNNPCILAICLNYFETLWKNN